MNMQKKTPFYKKVLNKVADQIIAVVFGTLILAALVWCGSYLRFIPALKDQFPKVQTTNDRQDECIADLQKAVDCLKEARKLDSVRKSTYQQIRSKPNIRLDELKSMKTK